MNNSQPTTLAVACASNGLVKKISKRLITDANVVKELSSLSTTAIVSWIGNVVGKPLVQEDLLDLDEILNFLDNYALFKGFDGPRLLEAKLLSWGCIDESIRCPNCYISPIGDRLSCCIHPDSPRYKEIHARIYEKKKEKLGFNWIKSHNQNCHFQCCHQKFDCMEDFIQHACAKHAVCDQVLHVPKKMPPEGIKIYLNRLLSALPVGISPYVEKIHGMLDILNDKHIENNGCLICTGTNGRHDGRICNVEARQRVALLLLKKSAGSYQVSHSYRHYKESNKLSGLGGY